jgi:hypothetical protein
MVAVEFLNNCGPGYMVKVWVKEGTTVGELLTLQMGHVNSGDYLLRLNRKDVMLGCVLQKGDRLSCTSRRITVD